MENTIGSGMIPMFLSGLTRGWEISPDPASDMPALKTTRRLLLACSGLDKELPGVAKAMAFGFGKKEAQTTIFRSPDAAHQGRQHSLSIYDGAFIGIAPDGNGAAEAAFAFIRNHLSALSAIPVALFFLLPGTVADDPDNIDEKALLEKLPLICPLDVGRFEGTGAGLKNRVLDWAGGTVWPMMETRWLADLVFPEPGCSPAKPEPLHSRG